MRFIVSSIKHAASIKDSLYYLLSEDASKLIVCKSNFLLNLGDSIEMNNDEQMHVLNVGMLPDHMLSKLEKGDTNKLYRKVLSASESLAKYEPNSGISDIEEINKRMLNKLKRSAVLFLSKLLLGSPIIIRFHNDADGSSGAYCIYKSIKGLGFEFESRIAWRMQRSIVYSSEDASSDISFANNFSSLSKPLLLIVDFGTSLESNAGIELSKDKFDIIWLDHHPIVDGFKGVELEHYINPWLFGGDSDYTAGLLACTFSSIYSNIDEAKEISGASLIGDYSRFAGEEGKELSELLELITSDTKIIGSKSLTPYDIESILSSEDRKRELLSYARLHLSEALDIAVNALKVYKGDEFNLYLLDFKNVRGDELRYPLPGRFASKLLSKIESLNGKPCIVVLHFSSFISIRLSKGLAIDLLSLTKKVKEAFSVVESSGGHKNAVSIKLRKEEQKKEVIEFVIKELGFGYKP